MLKSELAGEDGSSIIGMMIAVGIIGILAIIFSTMFSNNMKMTKVIDDKNEIEELRRFVRSGTSAVNTKAARPTPCAAGTALSVRRPNAGSPALILAATGANRTKFGKYYLKAKCTSVASEYQVYYSKIINSDGDPLFAFPQALP